jgi:hypothetical protein
MLSLDSVREKVPSAFQTSPDPKVSERYNFVNTGDILEKLYNRGWRAIAANAPSMRSAADSPKGKHTILLRNYDLSPSHESLGGVTPTIRVTNSHNWTSKFIMDVGLLRLLCSNGLYTAGLSFQGYEFRHDRINEDLEKVLEGVQGAGEEATALVEKWAGTGMTPEQRFDFANAAQRLRWEDGHKNTEHVVDALLQPRRIGDMSTDLWSTYNVVEENLRRGVSGDVRKVSELKNIDRLRDQGSKLWDLAREWGDRLN